MQRHFPVKRLKHSPIAIGQISGMELGLFFSNAMRHCHLPTTLLPKMVLGHYYYYYYCHHALTCRSGGDIIARHNKLRDCFANLCSKACLSPQLEKGPGLDFSRPADVLVPNWSLSNPAAFDLKAIHPLNTDLILEASLASGNSAEFGEIGMLIKNDQMCGRLGWTCIPLVVEVYDGWGCEAQECFSRLSKRLAMQVGVCETEALSQMYCLLGVTLMRQNARAILLRCAQTPLQDC